jgi:hypothetical protein
MTKKEKLIDKVAEKMYWLQWGDGFKEEFERHKEIWRGRASIIFDLIQGGELNE